MISTIRRANTSNIRRSAYRGNSGGTTKPPDHRRQTIRMLVSVVILFFISWSPFHFQRLGYVYFKNFNWFRMANQYLFYFSGFLYYLSSTLNPLLYTILSVKYREAFKKVILCGGARRGTRQQYTTVYSTRTADTTLSSARSVQVRGLDTETRDTA